MSPDDQVIVSTPGLRGISTRTGEVIFNIDTNRVLVRAIQFSPDSQRLAVATSDNLVTLRSASTGAQQSKPLQASSRVKTLLFSSSGLRLAAACEGGEVLVWEADQLDKDPIRLRMSQSLGDPATMQFGPSEDTLCIASWGGREFAWNLEHREPLALWPTANVGVYPRYLPDGRLVALGGIAKHQLWDSRMEGIREGFLLKHRATIVSADFSSEGRLLATASHDGTTRIWNLTTGQPICDPLKHTGYAHGVRFSPRGDRVMTASEGRADLWDVVKGIRLGAPHDFNGVQLRFTADGRQVLAVSNESYKRWDLPPPTSDTIPEWLGELAETISGLRVRRVEDSDGHTKIITESVPWKERFALWGHLKQSEATDGYTRIAQWFLADPTTRPPSPYQIINAAE